MDHFSVESAKGNNDFLLVVTYCVHFPFLLNHVFTTLLLTYAMCTPSQTFPCTISFSLHRLSCHIYFVYKENYIREFKQLLQSHTPS